MSKHVTDLQFVLGADGPTAVTLSYTLPEGRRNGVLVRQDLFIPKTGWFAAAIEELYELATDLADMSEEIGPIEYEDDDEDEDDD